MAIRRRGDGAPAHLHAVTAPSFVFAILTTLDHHRLQALTGGHVTTLYRELEQAGLSVSTRRQTHAVLQRALRDAVRWGRLVRNPADMADPPAQTRTRVEAWTAKELSRFLVHVADDRLFPLWRLGTTTGMRRGELLGLTWRALDLEPCTSSAIRPRRLRSRTASRFTTSSRVSTTTRTPCSQRTRISSRSPTSSRPRQWRMLSAQ